MSDDILPPKPLRFRSVFISYSSKDKNLALELVKSVESKGCVCWISCRDILPGAKWDYEVLQGLKKAEAIILLLTESANESSHVLDEVKHARTADKPVIVIRIGDVQPSELLAFWISRQNYIQGDTNTASLMDMASKILGIQDVWMSSPPPAPLHPPLASLPEIQSSAPRKIIAPILICAAVLAVGWAGWSLGRSGGATPPAAQTWSLPKGKTQFTLLNTEGTAELDKVPVVAGYAAFPSIGIYPASSVGFTRKAYRGQAIKFGHRLKSLAQGVRGPAVLHYYPLNARYSDESARDGRELVMDRATGWKKVSLPQGEFIDILGPDFVPKEREFNLNEVDGTGWTELFMGPDGSIPVGEHEFGVAITQGDNVLYQSKIKVLVPDTFTLMEADDKIRVLDSNGQPVGGRIIKAKRLISLPGYDYANGIGLSLKFQAKGEAVAGPLEIHYYLKAVLAPAQPAGQATMSVIPAVFFQKPFSQGFTAHSSWGAGLAEAQTLAAGATLDLPELMVFTGSAKEMPTTLFSGIHEIGIEVAAKGGIVVYRGILKVELE